jgi:hypothetical protein
LNPGAVTLLHSGIVYPSERDPTQLFEAVARLKQDGSIVSGRFKLRFRAAVHDDLLRQLASRHEIEAFIETLPPVAYGDALQEMLRADALLVMQGNGCNDQVPAKVYEYLRARKPIACLSDPAGDTAGVVRAAGIDSIADLASAEQIAALLGDFIGSVRRRTATIPYAAQVAMASRYGRTEQLARWLDEATGKEGTAVD